ncbi:hypothetical protein KR009_001736 [Drosophila setifemur]|nr:hypothetical protein KR009_001736 [Drosophila setifemur]
MRNSVNPLMLCLWCLPLVFLTIEARTRPSNDDRIVFPKDDDDDGSATKFDYPKANLSRTTSEATATTITVPLDATTRSTPVTSISTTPVSSTESTGPIASSSEEKTNKTIMATPTIVNRILLETEPKCRAGFELHANRCRKSA